MKTNGEWVYDEQMINILGLNIEPYLTAYGKGGKAMTAAVICNKITSEVVRIQAHIQESFEIYFEK